jgi:hypothetical protein
MVSLATSHLTYTNLKLIENGLKPILMRVQGRQNQVKLFLEPSDQKDQKLVRIRLLTCWEQINIARVPPNHFYKVLDCNLNHVRLIA